MKVKTAAVLGAGVMGAQIAALLVTAGIKTYLFDLSKTIVTGSLAALSQLKPAPLGLALDANSIIASDYDQDLTKLLECDLIIEAISDRFDYKLSLYQKVAPYIRPGALLATNTAGLSIESLANALESNLRTHFCGVHFFNPPRYMRLVEIIPSQHIDQPLVTELEKFLVTGLGKSVIYAKDTPGFIGNRMGVFSMLTAIHHAKTFNLTPDIIDVLMGPKIGRARSAIFRTLDIIGLDVFQQAVVALHKSLTEDPWNAHFCIPDWIENLINMGALGQKTKMGVYKKENEHILVYQGEQGYRPAKFKMDPQVALILSMRDQKQRMEALRTCHLPQAQFLWACFRDLFHYAAYHFTTVAQHVRDIDLALRWGYGWQEGPFEIWQKAGWHEVRERIESDIKAGNSMSSMPLPSWVAKCDQGIYETVHKRQRPEQRIIFPDTVLGEILDEGQTIFETAAVRLWYHPMDRIPILSFKTKKNIMTEEVLDGLVEAIDRVEHDDSALVIWQRQGEDFSLGEHLKVLCELIIKGQYGVLESIVKKCQTTFMRVKYSSIPVVVALSGRVLSSGCELALHAKGRVASLETYMGFAESSVGLLPVGGGCKELVLKGSHTILQYFQQILKRDISRSALEAKAKGYLCVQDKIVMNNKELLYLAKKQAMCLADDSYYPPIARPFPVAGRAGMKRLQSKYGPLHESHKMKDHEYFMGMQLAKVLCGGLVDEHTLVNEQAILDLECEAFMTLAKAQATQARIKYRLERGQVLRN